VFLLQDEDQNRKEIGKEDDIMTLKWEMQASKNHLLVEDAKPEFKIRQCLKNFVCGERQSVSHSKLCMLQWEPTQAPSLCKKDHSFH
jgi:predicted ATPase